MPEMKNATKLVQLCKQVAKSPEWRHPQRIPDLPELFELIAQVIDQQQDEIEQLKSRVEKLEDTPVVHVSAQPSDTEQARPF
jgi:hypothetical protein